MAEHSPKFLKLVDSVREHISETTIHDVKSWLDNGEEFVLVDVREDHEWQSSRIKQAIHLGKGIIERDIEGRLPDVEEKIVLYCGGGFRSALAAAQLQRMGYRNVLSMDGGIRAWREEGFPVINE